VSQTIHRLSANALYEQVRTGSGTSTPSPNDGLKSWD
jgi:hypothetical protein